MSEPTCFAVDMDVAVGLVLVHVVGAHHLSCGSAHVSPGCFNSRHAQLFVCLLETSMRRIPSVPSCPKYKYEVVQQRQLFSERSSKVGW